MKNVLNFTSLNDRVRGSMLKHLLLVLLMGIIGTYQVRAEGNAVENAKVQSPKQQKERLVEGLLPTNKVNHSLEQPFK